MVKCPNVVGVRLSNKDLRKLDRLAAQTHRSRGDVFRLLLDQAEVGPPDLVMRSVVGDAVMEAADVAG